MAQISVILPVYNREALVKRAIDSVLLQKGDWELILVDDGSTDGTPNILQQYTGDDRVHLIKQENLGVSAARNLGVTHSQSPYLAFLDSDDEWLPGKLNLQLELFEKKECEISQTKEYWIRNGVKVNPPLHLEKVHGEIFSPSLERCMITPSSVAMTRELFHKCGGFDESLPACEDYDLWLRITSEHEVYLISEYYMNRYAGHGDQLSEKYNAMDKFRIQSLVKRLNENIFSDEQKRQALDVLSRKLKIYYKGCVKRNKLEEASWCEELQQFINSLW